MTGWVNWDLQLGQGFAPQLFQFIGAFCRLCRVGMALAGKIEFDDEDGDEVFDDEVGGAPFFGIEASLRF